MKRLLFWFCMVCVVCGFSLPALAQQPPIIDRDIFFGDPEYSGAQISPDGKFMSFLKPYKNTRNIWVKKTEEPFSAARPMTAETKRPISAYFWSRDGKYLLYVQDQGGDENFNVYALNPAEKPVAGSDVPAARNITDAKGVRAFIYSVPRSDPDAIYVGLNDRDKAWHDLYKVKISTGERTLLRKNTDRIASWVFDNKDVLRLAVRSAENGDTEILRVDADVMPKIYSCDVLESCDPVHFTPDNKRVYLDTNHGGPDLSRLALMDPATGKEELVESDPMNRVDFGSPMFSDVTDKLIGTIYVDEKRREYFKDKAWEADFKLLQSKLPGKQISMPSCTRDEETCIVSANADTEPGEVFLFDRKTKKLTPQYHIREKLDRAYLAKTTPIRYKSSDGLEIPAYLTLPNGVPAKNLPLMVFPHGGPWARDMWGYNTYWQFWANRGYAVLAMNFRGSTGYGKRFINAGNNQWGDKMQDDITWGVRDLVAKGIADPKHVGIMGGSYGGYATLAGVTFTPDVYAAAVAYVAPSNLITLMESIPPYWEAGRKMFQVRMGDPSTPDGVARLRRQSPLNSADKIKTPLLVVQGKNDPRVNKRESDQIVIALRDRGFPVEYIVAPDEGHGFARPENNMAMIAAAEKFVAKYLDGRMEETMTPEAAARLKEITVDPKTVTLPKKVDTTAVTAPKLVGTLKPGIYTNKAKIEMGGQSMNLDQKTEIKEEGGTWTMTETTTLPMGEVSDSAVLDKGTLTVRKRSVKQGPANIEIAVEGNKATGKMNVSGQDRPIDIDLGGPLFADGPGAGYVISTLPLAPGYTATFRTLDILKQKPIVMQLKVVRSESVTVPAGTFNAQVVEISSADASAPDKITIWVAKDLAKPVKIVANLSQMNGATLTSELAKCEPAACVVQ